MCHRSQKYAFAFFHSLMAKTHNLWVLAGFFIFYSGFNPVLSSYSSECDEIAAKECITRLPSCSSGKSSLESCTEVQAKQLEEKCKDGSRNYYINGRRETAKLISKVVCEEDDLEKAFSPKSNNLQCWQAVGTCVRLTLPKAMETEKRVHGSYECGETLHGLLACRFSTKDKCDDPKIVNKFIDEIAEILDCGDLDSSGMKTRASGLHWYLVALFLLLLNVNRIYLHF